MEHDKFNGADIRLFLGHQGLLETDTPHTE